MKINDITGTISSLNDTIGKIEQQLVPLFTTKRFVFLHLEFLIHHSRVQELIKQLQNDITLIRQYLDIHSTGKLTPVLVDPHHLRKELHENQVDHEEILNDIISVANRSRGLINQNI